MLMCYFVEVRESSCWRDEVMFAYRGQIPVQPYGIRPLAFMARKTYGSTHDSTKLSSTLTSFSELPLDSPS